MELNQRSHTCVALSFAGFLATASSVSLAANGQRFQHSGNASPESSPTATTAPFTEALTGFDGKTNGFLAQGLVR